MILLFKREYSPFFGESIVGKSVTIPTLFNPSKRDAKTAPAITEKFKTSQIMIGLS